MIGYKRSEGREARRILELLKTKETVLVTELSFIPQEKDIAYRVGVLRNMGYKIKCTRKNNRAYSYTLIDDVPLDLHTLDLPDEKLKPSYLQKNFQVDSDFDALNEVLL